MDSSVYRGAAAGPAPHRGVRHVCRCREGPRLYRTTKAFLRALHLKSLEDLPEMPGLEADGQLAAGRGRRRADMQW
ncbi:MAG: hypothetical protein ACLU38_09105 [Dysosmobacter sp.]